MAFLLSVSQTAAYTPAESYMDLVAGSTAGYKDGNFTDARFDHPSDLAFEPQGKDLYVADLGNNRIRVIHTMEDNQVETIAGSGASGSQDGPISTATFNGPSNIVYTQAGLVVADSGDHLLRYIDLKSKKVSTLPDPTQHSISRMIYCASNDRVYFTDPTQGVLVQLDMKTRTFTEILKNNKLLPNPKALCYDDGYLYVADTSLATVYRFLVPKDVSPTQPPSFESGGQGKDIQSLTANNGDIYALQGGTDPLVMVYPQQQSIAIATAWGFYAQTNNGQAEPLIDLNQSSYCGFTTSPLESKKFYVCGVGDRFRHSIYAYKDYDYTHYWIGVDPHDFIYPVQKPPKTFRILVAGDSRVVTSPRVDPKDLTGGGSFLTDTYAKQLEFFLNTEAALDNVDTRFEVLTVSHPDENCIFYGNYDMPDLAKKYDIDLILTLGSCNYKAYYRVPLTLEGIPSRDRDYEFILKPLSARVPPGPAGFLYEIVQKQHLADPGAFSDNTLFMDLDHSDVRDCLIKMYDQPLGLLLEKLKKVRLTNGTSPRMAITYIPWDREEADPKDLEGFFQALCQKNHIPLIGIADEFNVLRAAYYPTQQGCCDHHYTAYGNQLIARLIGRHLIQEKLIPFEPLKKTTSSADGK